MNISSCDPFACKIYKLTVTLSISKFPALPPPATLYMTIPLVPLSASVALTLRINLLAPIVPSASSVEYGAPTNTGALSLPSITMMFRMAVLICWGKPMK